MQYRDTLTQGSYAEEHVHNIVKSLCFLQLNTYTSRRVEKFAYSVKTWQFMACHHRQSEQRCFGHASMRSARQVCLLCIPNQGCSEIKGCDTPRPARNTQDLLCARSWKPWCIFCYQKKIFETVIDKEQMQIWLMTQEAGKPERWCWYLPVIREGLPCSTARGQRITW